MKLCGISPPSLEAKKRAPSLLGVPWDPATLGQRLVEPPAEIYTIGRANVSLAVNRSAVEERRRDGAFFIQHIAFLTRKCALSPRGHQSPPAPREGIPNFSNPSVTLSLPLPLSSLALQVLCEKGALTH